MLTIKSIRLCLMLVALTSLLSRAAEQQDSTFRLGIAATPDISQKIARVRAIMHGKKENPDLESFNIAIGIFDDILGMEHGASPELKEKITAFRTHMAKKRALMLEELEGFELVNNTPDDEQEPGSPQSFKKLDIKEEHIQQEEKS